MKLYVTRPLNNEIALKGVKCLSIWKNPPTWNNVQSKWEGSLVVDPLILSNRALLSKINKYLLWSICPKEVSMDNASTWLFQQSKKNPKFSNLSSFIWDLEEMFNKEAICNVPYFEFILEIDLSTFNVFLYSNPPFKETI